MVKITLLINYCLLNNTIKLNETKNTKYMHYKTQGFGLPPDLINFVMRYFGLLH